MDKNVNGLFVTLLGCLDVFCVYQICHKTPRKISSHNIAWYSPKHLREITIVGVLEGGQERQMKGKEVLVCFPNFGPWWVVPV